MSYPRVAMPVLVALALIGTGHAAAPGGGEEPVRVEARAAAAEDGSRLAAPSAPGPIRVRDGSVRERILALYEERDRLVEETHAALAELNARLARETDPDLRLGINREIRREKQDLELRSIEIGFEIAKGNGDARRAAEFEAALAAIREMDERPAGERP